MTRSPGRRVRRPPPPPPTPAELRSHPAVRNYMLLSLAALFVLVVCLVDRGLRWWSLLPALIGCMSLLAPWSAGPPLVLVSLTGLILSGTRYRWGYLYGVGMVVPTVMDLVLCAAVLAYVIGQYRLISLLRDVFPTDPRRSRGGASPETASRRPADLVTPKELALVVLALPLWTGLSVAAWRWLIDETPSLDIERDAWRGLLTAWAVIVVVGVVAAVAGYARQNTATPEEGLLYLQDQLWRDTRREQSGLNRWLVWARLRVQQRRETS
jgi:hypothetical protein